MWKANEKQLGVEHITGHVAGKNRLTAKRSGGAVFPDGFEVLGGREEDLSVYSRILVKPPGQAEPALVERKPENAGLVAEGIPVLEARSYANAHAAVDGQKLALLYLT